MKFMSLLLLVLLPAARGSESPPNVIFIMADDMGYGDAGCYGQKNIKTPVIDRMAKEGMRFTNRTRLLGSWLGS